MRIPTSGLEAARALLDVHAHNIANVNTEDFVRQEAQLQAVEPRGGVAVAAITDAAGGPDLIEDVVGLMTAGLMYRANAKAFEVIAKTERSLLDTRA